MIKRWLGHKYEIISETRYHPTNGKDLKVKYTVEYTEKDEAIKEDYSNLKKLELSDLERVIETAFSLRQLGMHNINIWYTVEDSAGNWLIEDYCNDLETYSATKQEDNAKKQIEKLEKVITDQQEELEVYRKFIKKHNIEKVLYKYLY